MSNTFRALSLIEKLDTKKVFSVGSGSSNFEHKLVKNKHVREIYCINRPMENFFIYNTSLKKITGFKYEEADFISHKFKNKYDIIFFKESLQFILGEDPKTIDKDYLDYIKFKILDLVKTKGYIFIQVTNKEWFKKNKPEVGPTFMKYLDNCLKNITKALKSETVIFHKEYSNDSTIIIFQKKTSN